MKFIIFYLFYDILFWRIVFSVSWSLFIKGFVVSLFFKVWEIFVVNEIKIIQALGLFLGELLVGFLVGFYLEFAGFARTVDFPLIQQIRNIPIVIKLLPTKLKILILPTKMIESDIFERTSERSCVKLCGAVVRQVLSDIYVLMIFVWVGPEFDESL